VTRPDTHPAAADSPQEFGSGVYDEAARLDDALTDIDWTLLPPGTERLWLDAPSGRLAGIALGDPAAPRVLLLPGVTGSKEDFVLMLPLLAAAGYRVESYDLAGQYESAHAGPEHLTPPRSSYDYELFVDDLLWVLEHSRPAARVPVHVLGYSFAGTVAELALERRPDLFASLALMSAPPLSGLSFRGVKRIGWISHFTSPHVGASLMIWGVTRNLNAAPRGRVALVRSRFRLTRRQSVDDIIGLMMNVPEPAPAVRDHAVPALVAVGEHDLWPLPMHRRFAQRIGASIAVYRTGHSPCEEAPHQLVRDLLALYVTSAAGS
jgi:pimeloyl-ACP methyl ester carboxylesterase